MRRIILATLLAISCISPFLAAANWLYAAKITGPDEAAIHHTYELSPPIKSDCK